MRYDLKLNACGDLAIEKGDLVLISGSAEVLQRVQIALKTGLTEYFWDTTRGLPTTQEIFQKGITEFEIKEAIRKVAIGVEGVETVIEVTITDYQADTRKISIELSLKLTEETTETTLVFTGILPDPNTCPQNLDLPKNIGDLAVWIDTNEKELINKNGQGAYSLEDATLEGSTQLSLQKRGVRAENPLSTEGEHIVFENMPYLRTLSSSTFVFVMRAQALTASQYGLLGLPGFSTPGTSIAIDFILREIIQPRFYIERQNDLGGNTEYLDIPSIANSNFVLIISIDEGIATVYINGVSIGTMTASWTFFSSGKGFLFQTIDYQENPLKNFDGVLGEFMMYNEALAHNLIVQLDLWLRTKWDLL